MMRKSNPFIFMLIASKICTPLFHNSTIPFEFMNIFRINDEFLSSFLFNFYFLAWSNENQLYFIYLLTCHKRQTHKKYCNLNWWKISVVLFYVTIKSVAMSLMPFLGAVFLCVIFYWKWLCELFVPFYSLNYANHFQRLKIDPQERSAKKRHRNLIWLACMFLFYLWRWDLRQ